MLQAKTFADRWNIMCSPDLYCGAERTTNGDECNALYAWACGQWDEFHKPSMDEISAMPNSREEIPF